LKIRFELKMSFKLYRELMVVGIHRMQMMKKVWKEKPLD